MLELETAPFRLDSATAQRLAERYGTPLYVLSEDHFRQTIRRYKKAFTSAAEGLATELSYASKANGTLALLAIAHEEGCIIDVASEGEFRGAMRAGVPPSACDCHGNNKSIDELQLAFLEGARSIVADNFEELDILGLMWNGRPQTRILLRLAPGVDPITHERIATGQEDSKFGFNIGDGSAEKAFAKAMELGLPVVGFHCHVGSQLLNPNAQIAGGEALARFAVQMKNRHGFETQVINMGGGLGVRYTAHDNPLPIEQYCKSLVGAVAKILRPAGLEPILGQEPGRALVGECGVTLYRVGVVKTVPVSSGTRTYVSVDGGLGDNPRPALYGSEYTVERIALSDRSDGTDGSETKFTVCGRHCETDELFSNVMLPADLKRGDLLQVLTTGAYNSSMASNYNRYPRPATVLISGDGERLVQRRETWDDLFGRESGI